MCKTLLWPNVPRGPSCPGLPYPEDNVSARQTLKTQFAFASVNARQTLKKTQFAFASVNARQTLKKHSLPLQASVPDRR